MSICKGRLHSTESFGSVDGPGVRFVAFLQGCGFRCQYCHNADTWDVSSGEEVTAEELFARALRYRSYWGKSGGITVSGGEPLIQLDFVTELFRLAKAEGINTALDTAGGPFTRNEPFFGKFAGLMEVTDLVLLDIKHIDSEAHKRLTGRDNKNVLELARYLSDIGKPVWIRHVLVPGLTDDEESLTRLRAFLDTLKNLERVEVLPYHSLGAYKWKALGLDYPLEGVEPPSKEAVQRAREILGA